MTNDGRSLEAYADWVDRNELELAFDELELLGMANDAPAPYWTRLASAAQLMKLDAREARCRARVGSGELFRIARRPLRWRNAVGQQELSQQSPLAPEDEFNQSAEHLGTGYRARLAGVYGVARRVAATGRRGSARIPTPALPARRVQAFCAGLSQAWRVWTGILGAACSRIPRAK